LAGTTISLEWLIVSGAVNLVRRWVSYRPTSDGRRQCWSHPPSRSVFSSYI